MSKEITSPASTVSLVAGATKIMGVAYVGSRPRCGMVVGTVT